MGPSHTLLLKIIYTTNNGIYYQMNLVGVYQRTYFNCFQMGRSAGQDQIFIVTSIFLREESPAHLQLSSVEITWVFMSLIDEWNIFPLR